jgi:putative PIN family toxin of toxin-antitoxin system
LLTLCRYGAACRLRDHYAEIVQNSREVGELGGGDLSELAKSAEEEAAALAEVLPYDTPEDIHLVTSPPILNEVQRKLVERFGHSPEEATQKRFVVAAIAIRIVPDFDLGTLERYTRDRSDDMVVYTALEGRADYIVTTDNDLLEEGEGTRYSSRGRGRFTVAYSLGAFAEDLETSKFSLSEVPEIFSLRVGERRRLDAQL